MSGARYLYCVILSDIAADFGKMGIKDSLVYTVPCKDIAAVVHACDAKPYDSKDEEKVKEWVLAHQYIIDTATKRFGTVIPFNFDTIIKGEDKDVLSWLKKEYKALKEELERLTDKQEFTVQIFWDENLVEKKLRETKEDIKKLEDDIKRKPKGVAYMLRRKMEAMLREELREEADKRSKDFYEQVKKHVEEIKLEMSPKLPEGWKDKHMILALSCLVHKDEVEKLGEELGKINDKKTFLVRFTGPWAPYSFVGRGKKK